MKKKREKTRIFPLPVFAITFLVLGLLTTGQMLILGQYIDYLNIPTGRMTGVILYWFLGAAAFTFLIGYQINSRFEKPMQRFAEATKKVANGDFSIYVKPVHIADKMNYLDKMFLDFNKMVEQLGSIETLKTDFFSNVSHEIKTPISVIQNYAEVIGQDNISDAQRKEYALTIRSASGRLSELITNLLKLQKLERETIAPEPEAYDLPRQLTECALSFESEWESRGITFIVDIEDHTVVTADKSLMELVWNNLLSNALKFTDQGGSIMLTQKSTEDGVIVSVSDTGCGMDEETIRHIFEKFYQGDSSHATKGNGLGLALTKRILELMSCEITVLSVPGEGSIFTVLIPLTERGELYE